MPGAVIKINAAFLKPIVAQGKRAGAAGLPAERNPCSDGTPFARAWETARKEAAAERVNGKPASTHYKRKRA